MLSFSLKLEAPPHTTEEAPRSFLLAQRTRKDCEVNKDSLQCPSFFMSLSNVSSSKTQILIVLKLSKIYHLGLPQRSP